MGKGVVEKDDVRWKEKSNGRQVVRGCRPAVDKVVFRSKTFMGRRWQKNEVGVKRGS